MSEASLLCLCKVFQIRLIKCHVVAKLKLIVLRQDLKLKYAGRDDLLLCYYFQIGQNDDHTTTLEPRGGSHADLTSGHEGNYIYLACACILLYYGANFASKLTMFKISENVFLEFSICNMSKRCSKGFTSLVHM